MANEKQVRDIVKDEIRRNHTAPNVKKVSTTATNAELAEAHNELIKSLKDGNIIV